ncbi:LuxE/PaaK family acyltransferase [Psychroflexus halocasei]|uniref:Acyl-protein synthetase, LuxE n=1 Tax=Psychroflexus halocasei TaxID=908615 RepID=A0A1H4CZS8_9FLAO|nr:acyl transferase [Psychroflexus halocasei]SEA65867.1 Acyl-protein synthetase, LuxE [Psychroflexus halocasei]
MKLEEEIFNIQSEEDFIKTCLKVFRYQYEHTLVYQKYCDLLKVNPDEVKKTAEIPFLPIEFFKSHKVLNKNCDADIQFMSSGTTGQQRSIHYVADTDLYEKSCLLTFEKFYGSVEDFTVLALLPSYLERDNSSLVHMANDFIKRSQSSESGFYLNNLDELVKTLENPEIKKKKVLLIGVTFALLDLAENYHVDLENIIVMETGGMKGRRKEMIREEVHQLLKKSFNTDKIHSEYGMTELLSQAYSKGHGVFDLPKQMQVLIRDTEDPLQLIGENKNGGINVIDLANLHSCSFIATQDLGRKLTKSKFEVIGRFDNSDIRGCNLMAL